MHRALATILFHRGIADHSAAMHFLAGDTVLADPFLMHGMTKAVPRIRQAIRKNEQIVVYGDFDADGVTSTSLLTTAIKALGGNVRPYIPHRVDEGYGLNTAALHKLREQGAAVVITVDCGIRSIREVQDGVECGLDMIVTDHHSVGPEVPHGLAVINPKQVECRYGEDMLAGVGIAHRLADALFRASANDRKQPPFPVEDLFDLVAIGTVADLAPLDRAENRAMVNRGLHLMRTNPRPGVQALLEVSSTPKETMDSGSIGFRIGPRINAAGRLESARLAYRLLMAETIEEALPLAEELNKLNEKRQQLTQEMQEAAALLVGNPRDVPLIFAYSGAFIQGIVGLVAGRLTEQFYRPSVILHYGETESHGSCRSIEGFNITEALDQCAELLIRHGGHAQAAGFAVHNENIPILRQRLIDIAAERFASEPPTPILKIDAEVRLHELTEDLFYELRRLEPTGANNPAPLLASRRLKVVHKRTIGKENAHLKLNLADHNCELEAVAFRMGHLDNEIGDYVDAAYRLDVNEWNGVRRLQMVVEDLQPA